MSDKHSMTEDEIIADLEATAFTPEDRKAFAAMAEEELIKLHFGFGTGIRNAYGLWRENRFEGSTDHPDDASMRIIRELWARVREGRSS